MRVSDNFYERLELIMSERGMNQTEVAHLVRTAPSTLTRWRRGVQPQRSLLEQLAKALGVELAWLAHGTGPRIAEWNLPAKNEQIKHENRLMDMGYNNSSVVREGEPEPESERQMVERLVSKMTVPEMLDLAARLREDPPAMYVMLDAVKSRTAPPPSTQPAPNP